VAPVDPARGRNRLRNLVHRHGREVG
jgi:hypothetical protein